ncbi:MAG: glycoside hydrolase family 78 protein [Sedimentisphaerales bacterium]|nr:glycoside hydrolase family 78 protein [Sedimentisphaerales bacterium]
MKSRIILCTFVYLASSSCLLAKDCQIKPKYLRCEYKVNPLGIDQPTPRLSWIVTSPNQGQRQTAYQILVASSLQRLEANAVDLWDSKKVKSDETACVVYKGKPMKAQMQCFWKLRIWDKDGNVSDFSPPASWFMGLLKKSDFKAEWIGLDNRPQNIYTRHIDAQPETFNDCSWICLADSNTSEKYIFQKTIKVEELSQFKVAKIRLAIDGKAVVWINSQKVSQIEGFQPTHSINILKKLVDGNNLIAIETQNSKQISIIGKVIFEFQSKPAIIIPIDSAWTTAQTRLVTYGSQPWGKFDKKQWILPPPAYLRNDFEITKPVKRATVYTSALGLYQLYINGRVVGQDFFTPGWTDYNKRVYYNTYNVTQMLRQGGNAMGAILADGWYAGYLGWSRNRNHYGKNPRLFAQLCVEYSDETSKIFTTGPDWKASLGPIQLADILEGQTYDARKEISGWSEPNFQDDLWQKVDVTESIPAVLQAYPGVTVQKFQEIKPLSVNQPREGIYVYDMGTNFAGVVRLEVTDANPGDTITIRFAERLNSDGTAYTENLRNARVTDVYICKGQGTEIFQPQFTYHGFQYVEITGFPGEPGLDTITGIELTSATPVAGSFECSDETANQLYRNICQTQRANFFDVPTDCPQRDERMGWTGDAQIYVQTACMNSDVQVFFEKWLTDLRDSQRKDGQFPKVAPFKLASSDAGPAWADAGVICPWTIYSVYKDKYLLQQSYPSMKKFINFCKKRSTKEMLPPQKYFCYGDHLNLDAETSKDVIYTAYFAHSTRLTAQAAKALGKTGDAKKYEDLFEKIKTSFNKAYVDPNGRIESDTQTAYAIAIAFCLLDEPVQTKAASRLIEKIKARDWHLSTGFVGTKDLMLALAKVGRNDIAYKLFHSDTYPSWGFSIKNGATSIWERWNGWTPEKGFQVARMNSFAHYAFGSVGQWMFENIGGIKSDGPGFKKIIINPQPGGKLTWAKTSYNSIYGLIVSDWEIDKKNFRLNVSIPPNTTATVYIPAESKKDVFAKDAKFLRKDGGYILFEVYPGSYEFTVKTSQ